MENVIKNTISTCLAVLVLACIAMLCAIGEGAIMVDERAPLYVVGSMSAACAVFLLINKK